MFAWAALCLSCSAMTLLWWPAGIVPAVIVAGLGVRVVLDHTVPARRRNRGRRA